jgi:hypothetical protein
VGNLKIGNLRTPMDWIVGCHIANHPHLTDSNEIFGYTINILFGYIDVKKE